MDELDWSKSVVEKADESLLGFQRFNRAFVSELDEVRIQWNDTAAKDAFVRYLNPQREDLADADAEFRSQLRELTTSAELQSAMRTPMGTAVQCGEDCARLQARSADHTVASRSAYDRSEDASNAAKDISQSARSILASI